MNIIQSGNKFDVYGEEIAQYEKLPRGVYELNFDPRKGYSLNKVEDLRVDFKIYGEQVTRRLNKLLKVYNNSSKNVGAILTGQKGGGKTLFCKRLSQLLNEKYNIPTIIIKGYNEGLDSYLNSITQKCMVLFDEFEKNFTEEEQETILSYFDGLQAETPKLNIVTVNDEERVTEYLLNRTGRFRYLFNYDYPSNNELIEYIEDKSELFNIDLKIKEKLIKLIQIKNLTYDTLDTIFEDLYYGSELNDTLLDINIAFDGPEFYEVLVEFSDKKIVRFTNSINLSLFGELKIDDYDGDGLPLDKNSRKLLNNNVYRMAINNKIMPKVEKISEGKYVCRDISGFRFKYQTESFDTLNVNLKPIAIYFNELGIQQSKVIPQL